MGISGIGVAAQLLNFNTLIVIIGTLGIPMGLTKFVSESEKEGDWSNINDTIIKLLLILLIIYLMLLTLIIVFSNQISLLILDTSSYSLFLIVITLSFPFSAAAMIFESTLRGLKRFDLYTKASVAISLFTLIIGIATVLIWGITGIALSILISGIISAVILYYYFNKIVYLNLKAMTKPLLSFPEPLKIIFKIGGAALIDGMLVQLTVLLIRSVIIQYLGINSNGLYQAVYSISNNYISLFFMSLGIYAFPILSAIKDVEKFNEELNNIYRFTVFIIFPIIAITFVLREYIIVIFFSQKFISASDLFVYNFFGDYFKALSWVLGAWLIPRSKIKLWLILGIVYNVLYFTVFYILINIFVHDLQSIVISYAFVNVFHFMINLYFIRKLNSFRFRSDVLTLMIISTLCLTIILITSFLSVILGYIVVIPVFALWLKLCIKKSEISKVFELMTLKTHFKNKI